MKLPFGKKQKEKKKKQVTEKFVSLTANGTDVTAINFSLKKDEDGEPLTYTITTSDQNVAHLNPNGDSIQLTTLGYGLVTATVTATDACKASASVTFRILVRDETRPVDLYPIPVVSALNIRPGTSGQITVSISNKAGAVVWSGESAVTPFDPLSVDLSGVAGGSYYVTLQGAGTDGTYPIVKR